MPRKAKSSKYALEGTWIEKQLIRLVSSSEKNDFHDLFGAVDGSKCQMPVGSDINPKPGTWMGKMVVLAKSVRNNPSCVDDCFFIETRESQAPFKIGRKTRSSEETGGSQIERGNQKNWRVHVVLYALANETTSYLYRDDKWVHRHRCHKGYNAGSKNGRKGLVCINPFHLVIGTQAENRSDDACKSGCLALCKHQFGIGEEGNNELSGCIFTDETTGRYLPCLNNPDGFLKSKCSCVPSCFQ